MIELIKLTKRYGKFTAIDGVELRIEDGEIFGFLGPNGAGKTTTIKCIAGLIKPTGGDVLIDGLSIRRQPLQAKQRLGVIPDRPFLYEKLTGMEYLRFLCGLYGIALDRGEAAAVELLRMFQLDGWSDELIEGYSHGMKQRLVMAGAFLHAPRALVVDEPMVGLDPEGSRLIKKIFQAYAGRGRSILLSTHSLPVAQDICHRIGIVSRGKLIAVGTLDELRAHAQDRGDLESVFLALTRESREDNAISVSRFDESLLDRLDANNSSDLSSAQSKKRHRPEAGDDEPGGLA